MYVKLIDGRLQYAPKKIKDGDSITYNPTEAQLSALGYKPLVIEDTPTIEDGYHLEPTYTDTEEAVVQGWAVVEDEPVEPTPEERIAALEEELAATKILLGVE